MGLPTYVTNWDELIDLLQDHLTIDNVQINTEGIEEALEKYFPDIIELLKQIVENTKPLEGIQKIKGFLIQAFNNTNDYIVEWAAPEDILLTGVTYSQSDFRCQDNWDLFIIGEEKELQLFDSVYAKDFGQHKHFNVFFPVPKGTKIKLVMHNVSNREKCVWVDFEYLATKFPIDNGSIIIKYLAPNERNTDYIVLLEETVSKPLGTHIIQNTRDFQGYIKKQPYERIITLTADRPIRVVEFYYEKKQENEIDHDYDWKITLRWEDNTSTDIDMHCFIDHDVTKKVDYTHKKYVKDEENRMWLDYDYRSHGENGFEKEPEIVTIQGLNSHIASIQIINFNGKTLREDALLEIEKDDEVRTSFEISKDVLNNHKGIWVCDIDLNNQKIIQKDIILDGAGEFPQSR
ncbi:hypothetical protein [Anaerophilus nitritogenes]|uniref:hypothetical protein n=1 Tax=Anaerophilus nitritogenes TaxID=2498136 RepID=UPI00101C0EA1|nr:hypothetical protein [Anaerophilus nitritogenes]